MSYWDYDFLEQSCSFASFISKRKHFLGGGGVIIYVMKIRAFQEDLHSIWLAKIFLTLFQELIQGMSLI